MADSRPMTWEELVEENKSLRSQLSDAQARESGLREALENLVGCFDIDYAAPYIRTKKNDSEWFYGPVDEPTKIAVHAAGKALSPSPAADRWKAMEAVVEAARTFAEKELVGSDREKAWPYADILMQALSALEKEATTHD